ncbi:MAG: DUF5606 domain-containing protein [Bacteroidia bacterium]
MDLKKIVSITGKPGLYKVIAETPKKIIVQSLEDSRKKIPVGSNFQVALLDKITIYTLDGNDLFLKDIFEKIENTELELPSANDAPANLRSYFKEIAPNHDEGRVYASDLKKIIKWYTLLKKQAV